MNEELREALAELVACKDLKDDIERWVRDEVTGKQWPKMQPYERRMAAVDEYERRAPLAWEAARRALATPQAAAPSPAPAPSVEPAAYMYSHDESTRTTFRMPDERMNERRWHETPLYAAPSAPAREQAEPSKLLFTKAEIAAGAGMLSGGRAAGGVRETQACDAICNKCGKNLGFIGSWRP